MTLAGALVSCTFLGLQHGIDVDHVAANTTGCDTLRPAIRGGPRRHRRAVGSGRHYAEALRSAASIAVDGTRNRNDAGAAGSIPVRFVVHQRGADGTGPRTIGDCQPYSPPAGHRRHGWRLRTEIVA